MSKRGRSAVAFMAFAFIIVFVVIFAIIVFGGGFDNFSSDVKSLLPTVEGDTFAQRISASTELGKVLGNEDLNFLKYIFGNVPDYLIALTGGNDSNGSSFSAGIVIIGIWFLLLLSFADIVRLFSTFNTATSWIAAFVLTIIAANVKLVMVVAVFMLTITAGFGAFSVFAGIILAFILFLGVQFGSDYLREFAEKRKMSEMRMRAAMGSARAAEGLKAAAGFERAAEESR